MVAVFEGNWEIAELRIPGMIAQVRRNSLVPFAKADGLTRKRRPFRGHFGHDRLGGRKIPFYKE